MTDDPPEPGWTVRIDSNSADCYWKGRVSHTVEWSDGETTTFVDCTESWCDRVHPGKMYAVGRYENIEVVEREC